MIDVNDYLLYVENIVNNSVVSDIDKKYYNNMLSLYKITGLVCCSIDDIISDMDNKDFDDELYILFEVLSIKFYDVLNYWAWKKRNGY